MRILVFCDNHPRTASFIYQDYLAISEKADVRFVHSQPAENNDSNIIHIPFDFHSIRSKTAWYLEKYGVAVRHVDSNFKKGLNAFITEFRPDVIHCQFAYEGIKVWDCIDDRQTHRFLFSFRGYDSTYKLRNPAYRKKISEILTAPNVHAHFVCRYLRDNLNRNDVKTPRSLVIYTGIDVDHYHPDEGARINGGKVMLQVGAFNDKKGHEITLNAFKKFLDKTNRQDVTLRLVGAGKNLEVCKKLVLDFNIEDKVVFLGRQGKSEIRNELINANIFVHHSVTSPSGDQEGIPNAVAEAMAMKLPVIATVHAGIPELVLPEADGILVEEGDVSDYVDAMEKLIDSPRSTVNRDLVMRSFSLQEHVSSFLKYYSEVATNS
jgi:glycosyltransferase involved in cell wall biosynthesis